MIAFEFPEINAILRWQDLFPSFNKIALIAVAAALIGIVAFLIAGSKAATPAPKGIRNVAEVTVEFIEDGIVMQTMGKDGLGWTPFLLCLFVFIFLCNIPGVIPIIQMPATARMAIPMFLALLVWVIYNGVGFKHQGIKYITNTVWPPGVPVGLKPLVGVIEFISNIIVRPFSLTVRLFANMLAGHILILTFIGLMFILESIYLAPLVLPVATVFYLFEVIIVVGIQAFIFAALSAIYIGSAIEPQH